ncbi:MAG: CoA transferase [SAR202 cluster bacterium]|nr:CoA transferase [SAR202 cluster bacterium]
MTAGSGPLAGVRVIALSQFGAGPYGTMLLADLGAEIIKIEDPVSGGDVARTVPPGASNGDSLYFQSFNRGKKSVALDFRTQPGRDVLHDLVRHADALFNNLRGDLPAKVGITYEALKAVNPKIVTCSLSGFGATGPRAREPGYDALMQALAGYMSLTGEPDGPPAKAGVSIIDFAGGFAAALGLVAGVLDARTTGRGRDVDVALFDTAVSMLSYLAAWQLNSSFEASRLPGSAHQTIVPGQNFQTSDGWITVFCAKEKFWQDLAEEMDLHEILSDPRFRTFGDRYRNREALLGTLREKFQARTTADWMARLRGKVPAAPVNDLPAALAEEQLSARGMVQAASHPRFGAVRQVMSPILTEGANAPPVRAPRLGEHTDEVLRDLLGYSDERIRSLRVARVVA